MRRSYQFVAIYILQLLVTACLLAVTVAGVAAKKSKPSALQLKYQNLNYFENDPDIVLQEDNDDTPTTFTGDNTKAKIVNQENYKRGNGKFKYAHNTENGISVQQAGKLKDGKTFVVQGSYSYTGADGRRYRVRYTADEFGYHPKTELEIDLPDSSETQNDIPDVKPFKPAVINPVRVQKQTPRPVKDVVTLRPFTSQGPHSGALVSQVPQVGVSGGGANSLQDANPYGQPGPFVGQAYLPPNNDYLPPGSDVPAQAAYGAQSDFLAVPLADQHAAASSTVFQYV